MKRTIAAVTLLAATAAFAVPAVAMENELNMLEQAVVNSLGGLGIRDVDVQRLSLAQLAIIQSILNSDDNDEQKSLRIEAVIAR